MKLIRIFALAALVAALVFSAATADDKDPVDPRHGGLVSKANHLEIELVATAGRCRYICATTANRCRPTAAAPN